jgi:hypothetical protein
MKESKLLRIFIWIQVLNYLFNVYASEPIQLESTGNICLPEEPAFSTEGRPFFNYRF